MKKYLIMLLAVLTYTIPLLGQPAAVRLQITLHPVQILEMDTTFNEHIFNEQKIQVENLYLHGDKDLKIRTYTTTNAKLTIQRYKTDPLQPQTPQNKLLQKEKEDTNMKRQNHVIYTIATL